MKKMKKLAGTCLLALGGIECLALIPLLPCLEGVMEIFRIVTLIGNGMMLIWFAALHQMDAI